MPHIYSEICLSLLGNWKEIGELGNLREIHLRSPKSFKVPEVEKYEPGGCGKDCITQFCWMGRHRDMSIDIHEWKAFINTEAGSSR